MSDLEGQAGVKWEADLREERQAAGCSGKMRLPGGPSLGRREGPQSRLGGRLPLFPASCVQHSVLTDNFVELYGPLCMRQEGKAPLSNRYAVETWLCGAHQALVALTCVA